jgi:uncharacterized protein (TIGR02453 family)
MSRTALPAPFAGFPAEALTFLAQLRFYNEPAWFKPRKEVYETVLVAPMLALLAEVSKAAQKSGLPLVLDPKAGLFRIQRDVRFSRDKQPYKTNAAGVLSRNGRKDDPGMLYIHIEPEKSFAAIGFWQPPPELTRAWRRDMIQNPQRFLKIVRTLEKAGLTLSHDDSYKRLPRDFEDAKGLPTEPYVKMRHLVCDLPLSDEAVRDASLVEGIVDFLGRTKPLLSYGWELAPVSHLIDTVHV